MGGLGRGLKMARPPVPAGEVFFADEAFDQIDRRKRTGEELACASPAKAPEEVSRAQLEAREHLTAVAGAGAPAHRLFFENGNRSARPSEMKGRRQAGISAADDGDVGARRQGRRRFRIGPGWR